MQIRLLCKCTASVLFCPLRVVQGLFMFWKLVQQTFSHSFHLSNHYNMHLRTLSLYSLLLYLQITLSACKSKRGLQVDNPCPDPNAYICMINGTGLNLVLSAPHGGRLRPQHLPPREHGCFDHSTGQCVWQHGCGTQDSSRCVLKNLSHICVVWEPYHVQFGRDMENVIFFSIPRPSASYAGSSLAP